MSFVHDAMNQFNGIMHARTSMRVHACMIVYGRSKSVIVLLIYSFDCCIGPLVTLKILKFKL